MRIPGVLAWLLTLLMSAHAARAFADTPARKLDAEDYQILDAIVSDQAVVYGETFLPELDSALMFSQLQITKRFPMAPALLDKLKPLNEHPATIEAKFPTATRVTVVPRSSLGAQAAMYQLKREHPDRILWRFSIPARDTTNEIAVAFTSTLGQERHVPNAWISVLRRDELTRAWVLEGSFQLDPRLSFATASEHTSRIGRGVVKVGALVGVDGGPDASVIAREIHSRLAAIESCYNRRLELAPNLSGVLQMRMALSGIGKVIDAKIEHDTVHDEDLVKCVIARIMTWRLPAPSEGVSAELSCPFLFEPLK
jgi:hypothetical protein